MYTQKIRVIARVRARVNGCLTGIILFIITLFAICLSLEALKFFHFIPLSTDVEPGRASEESFEVEVDTQEETQFTFEELLEIDADTYYFKKEDLENLSAKELTYLREGIYAAYGYIFASDELNDFYSQYEWYIPDENASVTDITEQEQENFDFIYNYQVENNLLYEPLSTDVESEPTSEESFEVETDTQEETQLTLEKLLEMDADTYEFTKNDLKNLSAKELTYLRNSIYARHGYIFNSEELNEFFSQYEWYVPDESVSETDITEQERKNAGFIRDYQEDNDLLYNPN